MPDALIPYPVAATMTSRGPKILYIDYSVGFGGATKSLALTFGFLAGVERIMLTCQDPSIVESWYRGPTVYGFRRMINYRNLERVRSWIATRVRPHLARRALLKLLAAVDTIESWKNSLFILRLWRRHRFELIHLNNGFIPLEALLAARMLGIPCVVHLRGFLGNRDKLHRLELDTVVRVIAVSNAVADNVKAAGMPVERVSTIYDPVDVSLFDFAKDEREYVREGWGLGPADIAVGIFGRVIEWKGQREFVEALIQAMPRNPDLRGVIIGDQSDGAPEYFEDVKRIIAESGFGDRFILAGYQDDVEPLYTAIDIVVHASITPEPFGMVVPEGMAAGKAVIAAAAGGPCEMISPGVDGLLVLPSDVPALAEAILTLAGDASLRARLGANGYRKVAGRLTIEGAASQVMSVYRQVLGKENDGRAFTAVADAEGE